MYDMDVECSLKGSTATALPPSRCAPPPQRRRQAAANVAQSRCRWQHTHTVTTTEVSPDLGLLAVFFLPGQIKAPTGMMTPPV
jgi:hypothetical protein